MGDETTDKVLIERVQRGDKRAFDALVQKYQQRVMNVISRYLRNQEDVMDLAQETFIKAYRALPTFRGDSAFYTWLYRIAVNTTKNHIVAQSRRPPSADIDASEAEQYDNAAVLRDNASPESMVIKDELQDLIARTIEELPEELRVAISLRELEGMSYEEIAEVMACPVGTVRSRIFRAREAIDAGLKPLVE